jgi:hypothetical protein
VLEIDIKPEDGILLSGLPVEVRPSLINLGDEVRYPLLVGVELL